MKNQEFFRRRITSLLNSPAVFIVVIVLVLSAMFTSTTKAQITLNGDHSPSYNGTDNPWEVDDLLAIGNTSIGSMNVMGTSSVNSLRSVIGQNASGEGVATITGSGARWATNFDLVVGNEGHGTLNILAGGQVTQEFDANLSLVAGREAGGSGNIRVSDAGSVLDGQADLVIGFRGTATLSVENGGQVIVPNANIGNGTATITGDGSLWTNEWLNVGAGPTSGQTGVMIVEFGGKVVSTGRGAIGLSLTDGIATIKGEGSLWESQNELYVGLGLAGNGLLQIEDGGLVTSRTTVFGAQSSIGSAAITGPDSRWINSEDLTMIRGEMLVSDGGFVSNRNGVVAGSNQNSEITITGTGAIWSNTGDLSIGSVNPNANGRGFGSVNVLNDGLLSVDGSITLSDRGKIVLAGGTIQADTLDVSATDAVFDFTSGVLDVDHYIGDFTQNGGALAPGNSPGMMEISSDYTLNNGVIEIELAGTGQGAEFDFLQVQGVATLGGGMLSLSFLDQFDDTVLSSDSFTVLTALGGLSGQFEGVIDGSRLQTVDGLGSFQINYTSNSVVLSNFVVAVPEPNSMVLLSLVGIFAFTRRRGTRTVLNGCPVRVAA